MKKQLPFQPKNTNRFFFKFVEDVEPEGEAVVIEARNVQYDDDTHYMDIGVHTGTVFGGRL